MNINNNYLDKANQKYEAILEKLTNLGVSEGTGGLTKEELEEVLAEAGTSLEEMLNNLGLELINAGNLNTEAIVNAIRGNIVDMTTTNDLLMTLRNLLTRIYGAVEDLGNPTITIDTSDIENALSSLQELISTGNSTTAEVNDQMAAINEAMQDLIEAIQAQNNTQAE